MSPIIELQTQRLLLRQWQEKDYPLFALINADPTVMQYYPDVLSAEQSNAMASKLEALIAEKGWGFWAVEKTDEKHFIGFVGLHEPTYDLPVTPCVEIGWRLAKEHWGQGYATEAAKQALSVAFEKLDIPEVYSFTSITNLKSRAVMERISMINTGNNFEHPIIPTGHPLREHVLYKLTKHDWLTNY